MYVASKGLFPLYQFPLCQFPLCQFPLCQLPLYQTIVELVTSYSVHDVATEL